MPRAIILIGALAVLLILVILQILWIRKQQHTDYHDFPLHVFCSTNVIEDVLQTVEETGCKVIFYRVTEDIPLDEAPAGSTLAILLNVDAEGEETRFTRLLRDLARLPGVLSVGEGETLPA